MKQYVHEEGYDYSSIVMISYTGVFRYFIGEEIEIGSERPFIRIRLLTLGREVVNGIRTTNPYYNQLSNEVNFYVDDKSSTRVENYLYVLEY